MFGARGVPQGRGTPQGRPYTSTPLMRLLPPKSSCSDQQAPGESTLQLRRSGFFLLLPRIDAEYTPGAQISSSRGLYGQTRPPVTPPASYSASVGRWRAGSSTRRAGPIPQISPARRVSSDGTGKDGGGKWGQLISGAAGGGIKVLGTATYIQSKPVEVVPTTGVATGVLLVRGELHEYRRSTSSADAAGFICHAEYMFLQELVGKCHRHMAEQGTPL